MCIGEQLQLEFMISQKLSGCNLISFDARFFFGGASENENVSNLRLRKYR